MTVLAALISVPAGIGYPLLFAFVAAESAGALVPGETALIVAGALAGEGRLSLPLVIGVAAGAAIVGDNVGYVLGRRGLRRLIDRPGLRVAAAWLAGESRMPWRRFLFWNALGGIAWAATIGSLAYVLGRSASGSLALIGFVGVGIAVLVFVIARVRRRAVADGGATKR